MSAEDEAREEALVQGYLRQHGLLAQVGREPGVEERPDEYVTPNVRPLTTAPMPHPAAPAAPPPATPGAAVGNAGCSSKGAVPRRTS
jgi:hypothetical protein